MAAHAVLFVIFVSPFLLHQVLPLADYNNHLARAFITAYPEKFTPIYQLKWQVAPYFADLLTQPFVTTFGIYTAGKIGFVLGMLTVVTGVITLSRRSLGQISVATLLVYVFIYNACTQYGFVNYTFGMGVALFSLAAWISCPRLRSNWLLGASLLLVNFFLHAVSFGILFLLIGFYECWPIRLRDKAWWRHWLRTASLAIPPLLLLLISPRDSFHVGTDYGDIISVIQGVLSPTLFIYTLKDVLTLILFAIMIAGGIICIDRRMKPLVYGILLVHPFVLTEFLGVSLLNIRIPVMACMVICGTATLQYNSKRVLHEILVVLFLITVFFRQQDNIEGLDASGRDFDSYLALLRETEMEPNSPILTYSIEIPPGAVPDSFAHAATLAVIEKSAFVPTLFTVIPPVKPTAATASIAIGVGKYRPETDLMMRVTPDLDRFKYVMWVHKPGEEPVRMKGLEYLNSNELVTIYKNPRYKGL